MWKAIDLTKIDEILGEFKDYGQDGETFSKFIERTSDDEIPVWDWVDSVGVVTPQDFEGKFDKQFIEENFEDLANCWFNGLNGQIDFGIVLECVKEGFNSRINAEENGEVGNN